MSLTVFYGFWLSQTVSQLPLSFNMSLTVSYSSIELLHVPYSLLSFLAFCPSTI